MNKMLKDIDNKHGFVYSPTFMLICIWCLASVIFRPCEVLRSSVDAIASWAARRHTALLCLECHKIRVPAHDISQSHPPLTLPLRFLSSIHSLIKLKAKTVGKIKVCCGPVPKTKHTVLTENALSGLIQWENMDLPGNVLSWRGQLVFVGFVKTVYHILDEG